MSHPVALPGTARSDQPAKKPARRDGTLQPSDLRARSRRWFWRRVLRACTGTYLLLLELLQLVRRRPRPIAPEQPLDILLTGTFHSENWVAAHVRPLALSDACRRVRVVTTCALAPSPKVEVVAPPTWLRRTLGDVPARLAMFAWLAVRTRPDVVGGFHLLLNGMVAALLARIVDSRSLYFCVGGPWEVLDGGIRAENRLFSRLGRPDCVIEGRLIRIIRHFDLVITMGTRAATFLRERGVQTAVEVVPGGIDASRFAPTRDSATVDLILVGRLAPIKRIDVFLRAAALAHHRLPTLSAVIVGDGPQRAELEALARELGLSDNVAFVGHQPDVHSWLPRARLFVLTSDSEGLSLALVEAMFCGLPAIVSNVGDLADLVQDGVNGYLVPARSPGEFADRMVALLSDPAKRNAFSVAAKAAAGALESTVVSRRWSTILAQAVNHDR